MFKRFSCSSGGSWTCAALAGVLLAIMAGCAPDKDDLRELGVSRYRNKQTTESMAYLRQVLEIDKSDAEANYYMGLNYRSIAARKFLDGDIPAAQKACDTAIMYFTQAIRTWPNYMVAVASQNEALEARGKFDKALETAAQVASNTRGSSADHYVFLADEYRERGDYDNALRNYKIALSMDANSAKAYAGLGRLYVLTGDRSMAADSYRRAHEIRPTEPGVAEALTQLGPDAASGEEGSQTQHTSFEPRSK